MMRHMSKSWRERARRFVCRWLGHRWFAQGEIIAFPVCGRCGKIGMYLRRRHP